MPVKVITAPTSEPITLAEAKAHMSISDSAQDGVIPARISAARQWAEDYTGRSFITRTLELAVDSFEDEMELPHGPVSAIESIKYLDSDGVEQTLSTSVYYLDDYALVPTVNLAPDQSWPDTQSIKNAVKIRYTAGYGTALNVPEKVRFAINLTVSHWTKYQAPVEYGVSVTNVPAAIRSLLEPYKIHYV